MKPSTAQATGSGRPTAQAITPAAMPTAKLMTATMLR